MSTRLISHILGYLVIYFYLIPPHIFSQTQVEEFKPSSRAIGLGGSLVVQARDPSAMFWNPALLTSLWGRALLISVNQPFTFDFAGFTQFVPLYGTVGVALSRVVTSAETVDKGTLAWGRKFGPRVSLGMNVNIQKQMDDWFAAGGVGMLIGNTQVGTLEHRWRDYQSSKLMDRLSLGLSVKNIPLSDQLFAISGQFGMSYLFPNPGLLLNSGFHIRKGANTAHFGMGYEVNRYVTIFTGFEDMDFSQWGLGMGYTHDNFVLNLTYSREFSRLLFTLSARISPEPEALAVPYYRHAAENFKAKKYRSASRQYRQYLTFELHNLESDTAYHRIRILERKLARDRILVDSLHAVASRSLAQGETQYLRVAVILGKILELDSDNLKARTKLATLKPYIEKFVKRSLADGIFEFREENFFRAKESFNRVLLFDKENQVALSYIARTDQILANLGEEYFYRGVGYFMERNYTWAKEEFVRAMKYNPKLREAKSYLERTLTKLAENQKQVAALIREGQALEKRNRHAEAAKRYLEVLKLDQDNELVKARMATLKPKVARLVSKKYNEGLQHLRAQAYIKAQQAFSTVLSIDPEHRKARTQLLNLRKEKRQTAASYMAQAEEAFQKEDWRAALEMYSKVVKLEPGNSKATQGRRAAEEKLEIDVLFQQGRNYFNNGNYRQAAITFERILQLDPDNRVAKVELDATEIKIDELLEQYFNDGINLYTLDRYEEAIEMWNKALNLRPDHKGSIDYKKQALDRLAALKRLK